MAVGEVKVKEVTQPKDDLDVVNMLSPENTPSLKIGQDDGVVMSLASPSIPAVPEDGVASLASPPPPLEVQGDNTYSRTKPHGTNFFLFCLKYVFVYVLCIVLIVIILLLKIPQKLLKNLFLVKDLGTRNHQSSS